MNGWVLKTPIPENNHDDVCYIAGRYLYQFVSAYLLVHCRSYALPYHSWRQSDHLFLIHSLLICPNYKREITSFIFFIETQHILQFQTIKPV